MTVLRHAPRWTEHDHTEKEAGTAEGLAVSAPSGARSNATYWHLPLKFCAGGLQPRLAGLPLRVPLSLLLSGHHSTKVLCPSIHSHLATLREFHALSLQLKAIFRNVDRHVCAPLRHLLGDSDSLSVSSAAALLVDIFFQTL